MMDVQEVSRNYRKGLNLYDQGMLTEALKLFEEVSKHADPKSPEYRLAGFYIGETYARLAEEKLTAERVSEPRNTCEKPSAATPITPIFTST